MPYANFSFTFFILLPLILPGPFIFFFMFLVMGIVTIVSVSIILTLYDVFIHHGIVEGLCKMHVCDLMEFLGLPGLIIVSLMSFWGATMAMLPLIDGRNWNDAFSFGWGSFYCDKHGFDDGAVVWEREQFIWAHYVLIIGWFIM